MSLFGKIFGRFFTPKAAKTAGTLVTDTVKPKPVIPMVEEAAKKVYSINPEELQKFLGDDFDPDTITSIAEALTGKLPEFCRIRITQPGGTRFDIFRNLPGTDIPFPASWVECNVTGAGNRLRFLNNLVRSIVKNPESFRLA